MGSGAIYLFDLAAVQTPDLCRSAKVEPLPTQRHDLRVGRMIARLNMQLEAGPLRPEILRQLGLLDAWTDDEQIGATAYGLSHPGKKCRIGLDETIASIRLMMQVLRRQMHMDGRRADAC
ncbi:hypothetical protein [Bradyrhizobium sp. th.b2]|uniref:hypothetical protein n=1 Tax=Bradyrhizobium sp. th-b2 TaxID=172088 RepID=UPI00048D0F17|nr:hypothetical protein [Bradyrhizobium sp. th.b2]